MCDNAVYIAVCKRHFFWIPFRVIVVHIDALYAIATEISDLNKRVCATIAQSDDESESEFSCIINADIAILKI